MKTFRLFACASAPAALAVVVLAQGATDFSKIEIRANKVNESFYTLDGMGGTIGVLVGPDGVLMVDTQFAALSTKIAAAIRQITPQPIKFVVNTHLHGDHTGGNENFGKMGALIISREELRRRLLHPNASPNGQPGVPTAAPGIPRQTYRGQLTLYMNGEEIRLIAVPRSHTDGDTMVHFPGFDTIMTGDFYRSIQYPMVDRANGGSLQGLIDGLDAVIGLAGPGTKIIPGHGPIVDRRAVMAHREMVTVIRERVATLLAQGKSEEQVIAAKVLTDLDARVQQAGATGERFLRQVYAELKASR